MEKGDRRMETRVITVKQDGTGEFGTIAEAFAYAEMLAAEQPVEILIGEGKYKEKLSLEKDNVTLIGAGKEKTVITYDDYALFILPEEGVKRGTFRSYTMYVHGDRLVVRNLTIENTAGYGAKVGQAVALYADGAKMMFENCRFLSRQDTLFTAPLPPTVVEWGGFRGPREHAPRDNSVQYYKNCYIEGDVDFIFGGATAYFEGCHIHSMGRGQDINGYVTAASTPEGRNYGYVFEACRFTSECAPETVYLGRPWRSFAKTVILRSELGEHIKREGWHDWNKEDARRSSFYAEYQNFGPGAAGETGEGTEGPLGQRAEWTHQLTLEEAQFYTKEQVLKELYEAGMLE